MRLRMRPRYRWEVPPAAERPQGDYLWAFRPPPHTGSQGGAGPAAIEHQPVRATRAPGPPPTAVVTPPDETTSVGLARPCPVLRLDPATRPGTAMGPDRRSAPATAPGPVRPGGVGLRPGQLPRPAAPRHCAATTPQRRRLDRPMSRPGAVRPPVHRTGMAVAAPGRRGSTEPEQSTDPVRRTSWASVEASV
jgi:hypothetical protein